MKRFALLSALTDAVSSIRPAVGRSALFVALPLVLMAAMAPALDTKLKASEHGKLGKSIAAYFTAVSERKGINEAFSKATANVDKSAKKVKGTDVMTLVEDWESIFAVATTTFHGHKDFKKKGKHVTKYSEEDSGGFKIEGSLYCPKSYSARKGDPIPLILVIPDEKEKTSAVMEQHWPAATTQDDAIVFVVQMPNNVRTWDKIGSPPTDIGGIYAVMSAFGHLKDVFKIDVNRVFVAGRNKGIGAAVATAASFPHVFAGVIGYGGAPEDLHYQNFTNLPSLMVNSGAHGTTFGDALKSVGIENCTEHVGEGEPAMWAWIAEQKRNAYPEKLHLEPVSNFATSTNWISLEGISVDENPVMDASFDRAANTVTIDATNVVKVHVYFNDVIADLSKPVKVILNGEEREQIVPRNRRTLFDMAFRSGDWGRVFVNRQTYDVPIIEATADEE